jgi:rhodanese-related sulfurtransferase
VTTSSIEIDELAKVLKGDAEIALLDVREVADFVPEHLRFAVNAPLSRLELVIHELVPRFSTPVILVDDGEAFSREAAVRLQAAGYSDVRVLTGGTQAWKAAGFEVYAGRNTPGVVFGEVVQHELQTPEMTAEALFEDLRAGVDIVMLDVRPQDEFEDGHIAGAIACAGSELAYRTADLLRSSDTRIVVNCGGRTRAILGAQGLLNLGFGSRVAALSGGTMAWLLAGFSLEVGPGRSAPLPAPGSADDARARAAKLATKHDLPVIDEEGLAELEHKQDQRTLYRFDVRSREEYLAGHPGGFKSTPDGELFSRVVKYIGTRHARVVLYDPEHVRDVYSASWLAQQGGYELYLYRPRQPVAWEAGLPARRLARSSAPPVIWVDVAGLQKAASEGSINLFDVDLSSAYARRHIAGARYTSRRNLLQGARDDTRPTVITSADGVLARIVASELSQVLATDVRALLGGTNAWVAAGAPTEAGGLQGPADDVWESPNRGTPEERQRRMREYLDWELSLVDQNTRDGSAPIHVLR